MIRPAVESDGTLEGVIVPAAEPAVLLRDGPLRADARTVRCEVRTDRHFPNRSSSLSTHAREVPPAQKI
jgi:hypothetical protein